MEAENKTTLGLEKNLEALLCYLVGWLTGLVFLILEKENRYVRYHAMQSLAFFVPFFVLRFVLAYIPVIGLIINLLLIPVGLVIWILLMYKAFNGQMYKLPYIGDFAEKQINKTPVE